LAGSLERSCCQVHGPRGSGSIEATL
jgi:hypothetical protein